MWVKDSHCKLSSYSVSDHIEMAWIHQGEAGKIEYWYLFDVNGYYNNLGGSQDNIELKKISDTQVRKFIFIFLWLYYRIFQSIWFEWCYEYGSIVDILVMSIGAI